MPKKTTEETKALTAYKMPAEARVSQVINSESIFIAKVKALKIASAAGAKEAGELRDKIKGAIKKIESLFEDVLAQAIATKKSAEATRKLIVEKTETLTSPFTQALTALNGKLLDFERKESDRLAALAKAEELKKKGKTEKAQEVMPAIKTVENRAASVGASFIDNWKGRVTDFSKLPDEYKIVNQVLLNEKARELKEKFSIPGAESYNDKYIR